MEEVLADSRKHARSTAGLQFVLIFFNFFAYFQVEILVY